MGSRNALKILSVTAAAVAFAFCTFVFMKAGQQVSGSAERPAPEILISYRDLPAGSLINATLSMSGKVESLEDTGSGFTLPRENERSLSLPYSIKATLKTGNDYRDFLWEIDSRGVAYNIIIDGYTPRDKVTYSMNDQAIFTIPFDWSGRIGLSSMLLLEADSKPCFDIHEGEQSYGFCHFVRGKKAS